MFVDSMGSQGPDLKDKLSNIFKYNFLLHDAQKYLRSLVTLKVRITFLSSFESIFLKFENFLTPSEFQ